MNILVYAVIILAVLAIGATIYALMSARDGYEDDTGFHPAPPERQPPQITGGSISDTGDGKTPARSLLQVN